MRLVLRLMASLIVLMCRVRLCTLTEEGPLLLHEIGVETHGLDPSATYVPHVMFNQVYP